MGVDSEARPCRAEDVTDVKLLNLGTWVCATESGIPADVAAQLAPDPRHSLGDCS
jgi:hypothetical protein